MAKENNQKLVLVDASAQPMPVYQLMSAREFSDKKKQESLLRKKQEKVKSVRITGTISSHDLENKTTHIREWLDKGHGVKVAIKNAKEEQVHEYIFSVNISDSRIYF